MLSIWEQFSIQFNYHWDFKGLNKRTASDKLLRDKAFNVVKNPKYDKYQGGLASMVYQSFNKKTSGGAVKKEIMQKEELV